ncbi:uncharacterized protein CTHT_0012470 [Thermochaetoides thermophila DSM 1495]|uniref:HhH-GPD domain-containing protein n=1 Tax=Chaetomium thermophilum (strain DSM 1495 / CBS 144.50 / IMI 039719) TaxID=759272 RepID=G0S162_CHATD|nr:hypothetical protein CTHT_0012470 [Thermochaetoides thermophila DSM 1495]EGS22772.1 hypothetical protein CTHT_0012470 [Thermochaetoides thermophila DSM 1495]
MLTRAAFRRLTEAAAVTSSEPTSTEALSAESSTSATAIDSVNAANVNTNAKRPATAVIERAAEHSTRKRVKKERSKPVQREWTLPHGMGVVLCQPAPRTSQPEEFATSSAVTSPEGTFTSAIPTLSTTSVSFVKQSTKEKAVIPTKQTHISLRVTEVTAAHSTKQQKKQDPPVKRGASGRNILLLEQGIPPAKRTRITGVKYEDTSSQNSIADVAPLEVGQVKVEEKKGQQPSPRLLIFRGIAIKNSNAIKICDTVTVDATQVLDPDFRIKIKRGKDNPYGLTPGFSPYPYRRVPTPEACEHVYRILADLHGEVKQPEKMPAASLEVAGCGEVPCVLDALLRTLISGNTLMALADAAVKNLVQHYGLRKVGTGAGSIDWDKVRLGSHRELAETIKIAGNGPKKASHIKQILDMVYAENLEHIEAQTVDKGSEPGGKHGTDRQDLLSLDYMHRMTKDEAMAKLVTYPGVGIKTAACVTLFCLRLPCFAVDTHVHKFCRWLGWVPPNADPDNCFRHGDVMVPDHLKYGLHQLFIRHGQQCFKCRKATKPGTKEWDNADPCPLEHLLDRSKDEAGSEKSTQKSSDKSSGKSTRAKSEKNIKFKDGNERAEETQSESEVESKKETESKLELE